MDPTVLACKGAENDSCLTPQQVEAVRKVYGGARHARTGEPLFPGWARGSEQGWRAYITEPREPVRVGLFRYFVFHDPAWDWRTFDWDKDVAYVESQVPYLSATSRDLSAFKNRGGKLIMYTGLADPVVPPEDTINYYEAVTKAVGSLAETQKFFRFFPAPGMGHCGSGAGPNTFDALGALEAWVEQGRAPSKLVASHSTAGRVDRTRPLCPYPQVAKYLGANSIDDEASFVCGLSGPGTATRPAGVPASSR
jgi:feruloyl esterase